MKLQYQLFRAKNQRTGKPYPKWRIRYLEGRKPLFSETGYTDKGATEARAKQKLQEIEKERHEKAMGMVVTSKEPIESLISRYLTLKAAKGGKQKMPASAQFMEQCRSKLDFWVNTLHLKTLGDIKKTDVELAQAKIPHSPQTRDLYATYLRSFTRWCFRNDLLARDPLAGLEKHAAIPTYTRRALTLEEIPRLLAVTSDRRALIYKLALLTGMRRGELDSLQIRSVDWAAGKVHLQAKHAKNRKAAEFPLPADFLQELFVFCAGRPLEDKLLVNVSPSKSARTLKAELRRAGIPVETSEGIVDFHSLRVTFLTLVNELGEDAKTVQELGRHADPRLTFGKYVKQKDARLRSVITQLADRLPGTNKDIPRLGMHHTGVTNGVDAEKGSMNTGLPEQRTGSRYDSTKEKDKAGHSRTSPDIKQVKAATKALFQAATKPDISSHSETSDVSHRHHTLISQITEVLSRLPADALETLLQSIQSLQRKAGAA